MDSDLKPSSQHEHGNLEDDDSGDNWYEDGLDDGFDVSEMSREHAKRYSQFHTIGYRDGLMAGKDASAQEGFNAGFKQSVLVGYNFGFVRGITSALASLPEHMKDKLSGTVESKSKLENLRESIQHISTHDALKMFCDDIALHEMEQPHSHSEGQSHAVVPLDNEFGGVQLGRFSKDLKSILQEYPEIKQQSKAYEARTG